MINAEQAMSSREASGPEPTESEVQDHRGGDDRPSPRELMVRILPRDHEVDVSVTDTGPGIEPKRHEEIFRPYVSSRAGGTGLGLPIARRIVEEHGGSLTVASEVGKGSEFNIRLPR
jgi:signal transduction histidine kinase